VGEHVARFLIPVLGLAGEPLQTRKKLCKATRSLAALEPRCSRR
jgi:hypothetical protein